MLGNLLLMTLLAGDARLTCRLVVPAEVSLGAAVPVRFTLRNDGGADVAALSWNTPLEGLIPKALVVRRGGHDLAFEGPTVKRGDPEAEDYVTVRAGAEVGEEIDLADGYRLEAGDYTVRFDGRLHDVAPPSAAPRPRDQHRAVLLTCGPVPFTVRPGR